MINVQINETDLLDLFMNRLEFWTSDSDTIELYKEYIENLINDGCFEGWELDVNLFIDNLYVNDTTTMDKKELDSNNIDIDDWDKILVKNEEVDLYLVSSY